MFLKEMSLKQEGENNLYRSWVEMQTSSQQSSPGDNDTSACWKSPCPRLAFSQEPKETKGKRTSYVPELQKLRASKLW